MLSHLRIDTPPWTDARLHHLDEALVKRGSRALAMRMDDLSLEEDGDHFTCEGQTVFHRRLASLLNRTDDTPLLVLSDSTIDFHNWVDAYTGWADADLTHALAPRPVTIDAVCGSGFVAGATNNEHFHARLSTHLRNGFRGDLLLIGGWNDERMLTRPLQDTVNAIDRVVSLYRRYASL
ncbi:MAG: hypothetical protein VXW74_04420 [Candidatus Thermoplasmatota archaeon]|nr:hypothetical protein [Candidatus Thermoplasmatota archaeon]